MSVFSGFPCTKESVGEDEDREFWLGCLLGEDTKSLEAGPGSSCRVESRGSSSLTRCSCRRSSLTSVSRLLSHVYLVMVTPKGGRSRPQRSPSNSVPEAWIPISERFTEILGRSQEGERGRENGNKKKESRPRIIGWRGHGL